MVNVPIDVLALITFQINKYNYHFYVYIFKILAYDALLGHADFLTHYHSVVDFDASILLLPPPTDKPPPCPIPDCSCSVNS